MIESERRDKIDIKSFKMLRTPKNKEFIDGLIKIRVEE